MRRALVVIDVCHVKARGMIVPYIKWVVISRLWLVPMRGRLF